MKAKGVVIDITMKQGGTIVSHERFDDTCTIISKTRERYGTEAISLKLISPENPDVISYPSIEVKIELNTSDLMTVLGVENEETN